MNFEKLANEYVEQNKSYGMSKSNQDAIITFSGWLSQLQEEQRKNEIGLSMAKIVYNRKAIMDEVKKAFEIWWDDFWHTENKKMDWRTATELAFFAGANAAQQSRAVDLGGARENFCELHNTNYVLVGYCPICHPNH